jgi:hypothetical protein
MAILQVVLTKHTHRFESNLMMAPVGPETLCKNPIPLDATVEALVPGSYSIDELPYVLTVLVFVNREVIRFSFICTVSNPTLSFRHAIFETIRIPKHRDVMRCSVERTINPNQPVLVYCKSKLVRNCRSMILVTVNLCGWLFASFIGSAVHPINANDEDGVVFKFS